MRSRFLVGEHNEVDPRAARVLQHGLQHLLQLEDDRPLLAARAPDPAQDDPHVDEVLLDVGDRSRVDQEVVDAVVPHLTAFTKSMLDEVGDEQEEEDQHAGSIYSGSNLCSSGPSLNTIFAKNPFPRHIASKLTIVSKFYQIVRVEKCALNTDSTIPTQSIILSDHVVGKMFI